MLALAAAVYLSWWFAVEWLLPGAFNPLPGRLLVVGYFVLAFVLCKVSPRIAPHAEQLYYLGATFLVGHYFYLFRHNALDPSWSVGTYVVVFALFVGIASRAWLYAFAVFSAACGVVVWWLEPAIRGSVFLPGLLTVLVLCLVMLLGRVRLLENLSASTDRFQSLFDASFEGVSVHDRGTIIDINASFVELFGYTRDELIGSSVLALNVPECRERVQRQIKEVPSGRYESIGLRKDGTQFAIEISSKPHAYRGRMLRIAAVRDVSDRKRAEAEREALIHEQAARASAQESIRLRDEFISIASHELRTPITSLMLNIDGFAHRVRAGAVIDLEAHATRVKRQLSRMERLVETLLDVSRLNTRQMALQRATVELEALVTSVVDALAEDLRRARCDLRLRATGPLTGEWDRLRLEQVVENLLRNALIYGAGKPIDLTLARDGAGHALITVRDHGLGIEPAMQQKVFERFERGVSSQHYGGLGLGLYITKQIVDAHAGTIWVESEPGQGATFHVSLPLGATSVPDREA